MGKQGRVTGHIGSVPTCVCSFPVLKLTPPRPLDVGVWLHTPHFVVSRHSVCNGQFRSRDRVTSRGLYSQSEVEPRGKPKLASQNQGLFPKQIQLCPSPVPCHLLVPFAPAGLPTACRGAPGHPMSRKCQGVEVPTGQLQPNPFSVGDTF